MIVDCHAHLVPPDLLAAIRKDAATLSEREADRGRRQPGVRICRRQADRGQCPSRCRISRAASPGWASRASTNKWSAAGSICSAMSCRAPRPKPGARLANDRYARRRQSRAAFRAAGDRASGRRRARSQRAEGRGNGGRLCRRHDRHTAARRRLNARPRRSRPVLAGRRRDRRVHSYSSELSTPATCASTISASPTGSAASPTR